VHVTVHQARTEHAIAKVDRSGDALADDDFRDAFSVHQHRRVGQAAS
jgi:hypothetical protein